MLRGSEPLRRRNVGMAKAPSAHAPAPAAAAAPHHELSKEQLRAIFRSMLLQRTVDNRGFQLNRQGKIPFAAGSEGHEAVQAGTGMAFQRGRDLLFPYYRDVGLCMASGFPTIEVFYSLFARAKDNGGGRQFPSHLTKKSAGIYSFSSIIAGHMTHAVGAAYALKYRNEHDRVAICTFGEGATSEGEWHEAMNFAGVQRLPIVFVCENNQWAISTPQEKQMAVKDVAIKAAGYGMEGVIIDGFDPIAVYDAVTTAREKAVSGGGPTLIEAKCYRFLSHTTDDDDRTYRSKEEVESHRKDDPVPRFERWLVEHGIVSPADVEALKKDVLREVNECTDAAEAEPYPQASELYTNLVEGAWEPWQ
ncbi:thiamine pyrophosphate-dependent dehydrogenase E1 component subunit alpha [bacterium]|nr:MAG: thiamine pyrophosphate-dependent dehydrogenase E1 component subunit alpha [bacterium]